MSDEVVNNLLGRQLGPCELLDVVGTGTYGTVFRARDVARADVWRAVKVMVGRVADVTAFKFRLPQEIHSAVALSHPHIVPIYRFGSEEGLQYLVMEFVESVSLGIHLRQTPVDGRHADTAIHRFLRQTAAALDFAHARRVVHGDVSPENILVRMPDRHALVTDFCIGRVLPLERIVELGIAIDCAYRSPEQCGPGGTDLTPASDIYSLAAVLWLVATGAPPFGTGLEARARHVGEPVPDLSQTGARLPSGLQDVLAKGLAKSPGDRYSRASQLVSEFIAASENRRPAPVPPIPRPQPQPQPPPPPPTPAPVVPTPVVAVPVAPAPVSAPVSAPMPVPVPVPAGGARSSAAALVLPTFDPKRELRESPLWRPFPTAEPVPASRQWWRLPLWLLVPIVAGLLVAIAIVVVTLQSLGSGIKSTARSTASPPPVRVTAVPTPGRSGLPSPVPGTVGSDVVVAGVRLTVSPASAQGGTLQARTGYHLVAVDVIYVNNGRPPVIVSPYDWEVLDGSGAVYGGEPPGLLNDLPQRQLPSGGEAHGLVAFAVPNGATGLVLHYNAEVGDDGAFFPLS